jgi:hypothetical protein
MELAVWLSLLITSTLVLGGILVYRFAHPVARAIVTVLTFGLLGAARGDARRAEGEREGERTAADAGTATGDARRADEERDTAEGRPPRPATPRPSRPATPRPTTGDTTTGGGVAVPDERRRRKQRKRLYASLCKSS